MTTIVSRRTLVVRLFGHKYIHPFMEIYIQGYSSFWSKGNYALKYEPIYGCNKENRCAYIII